MITRKMISLAVIVFMCAPATSGAADGELVLAEGGRSDYQIVVADDASPSTKHGAKELQSFLEQISGAKLPIVSDKTPVGQQEIILGDNAHLRANAPDIDLKPLGAEGYAIRTAGEHLVIAGGSLRGNMYGVYGFLEDHLGCRWFAPGVSRIPQHDRLAIESIDDRQVPALEYRELFLVEGFDPDWCVRNRMNSSFARLDETRGGKIVFARGYFCHTFYTLVPPEKYFDDHPEYFALVRGQRQRQYSQLCCTNPDVIRLCIEGVRRAMREQPHANVFSVSQTDGTREGCQCSECQELARREDSQIAPMLQLVNRVAEAVEEEFPDKIVETLAYTWGRRPPKNMRPRPNVVIRFCVNGDCCRTHPLATCETEATRAVRADLEGWAQIAPRLWIWNYVTSFHHYLLPLPNQRARGPNIKFFLAHNVTGIFEQDAGITADSELAALGGYMTAKFLWNPDYDPEKAVSEFLDGYYGRAAGPVSEYIDMLHDYVEEKNIHVTIMVGCDSPHLTDELLIKADALWQRAEELAAGDLEVLRRVKLSRMSVDYAILERGRLQAQGKLPVDERFLLPVSVRFTPFFETLEDSNLTRLKETQVLDKQAYRRDLAKDLNIPGT